MIKDIPQVQQAPISQLKLTHFMGLMTYTKNQWTAFFTQDYPAQGKLPGQRCVLQLLNLIGTLLRRTCQSSHTRRS